MYVVYQYVYVCVYAITDNMHVLKKMSTYYVYINVRTVFMYVYSM